MSRGKKIRTIYFLVFFGLTSFSMILHLEQLTPLLSSSFVWGSAYAGLFFVFSIVWGNVHWDYMKKINNYTELKSILIFSSKSYLPFLGAWAIIAEVCSSYYQSLVNFRKFNESADFTKTITFADINNDILYIGISMFFLSFLCLYVFDNKKKPGELYEKSYWLNMTKYSNKR
ncbi:hypothetical protein AB4580_22205 [Vibrio splendidus]